MRKINRPNEDLKPLSYRPISNDFPTYHPQSYQQQPTSSFVRDYSHPLYHPSMSVPHAYPSSMMDASFSPHNTCAKQGVPGSFTPRLTGANSWGQNMNPMYYFDKGGTMRSVIGAGEYVLGAAAGAGLAVGAMHGWHSAFENDPQEKL